MKKVLVMLLFMVVCYGCKKTGSSSDQNVSIIGKWIKSKTIFHEIVNGKPGATTETHFSDPNNYIQFNSNGTGNISEGGNGTYHLTTFNYSSNGTSLNVAGDTNNTQTITTLTKSSLVIHSDLLVHNPGDIGYEYITDTFYTK